MKRITRILAVSMLSAMCGSFVTGCGNSSENVSGTGGRVKMSYWVSLSAGAASVLSNYKDMEMYKKMEELTGVEIEFKHPPTGQASEQFNLIIASRDLPDMMEFNWGRGYPGGAEKAINDNIILGLNELVASNSPNFKSLIDSDDVVRRQSVTDSGKLYAYPAVGTNTILVTNGPVIREDWLNKVGLESPETIDEWETVLRAFKNIDGVMEPLTGLSWHFTELDMYAGAFGIGPRFYVSDNQIKFGPIQPEYKEYVETLKRWYVDGLLDQDFLANDNKAFDDMIISGKSGLFYGSIGGSIGNYMNTMKKSAPEASLIAIKHPVLKKGDVPQLMNRAWEVRSDGMVAITSANKNPEEAAKWLDYFYSEEGNLLKNFGIEGMTYNLTDGYPVYSDLILNNPDGLSIGQAISKYTRAATASPGLIDPRYHEQYYDLQQQKDAMALWNGYAGNTAQLPPVTPTAEEADELSIITATINSYISEMFIKFVLGTEPMENYDSFVKRIKDMNIERAIEINQNAYERYLNR